MIIFVVVVLTFSSLVFFFIIQSTTFALKTIGVGFRMSDDWWVCAIFLTIPREGKGDEKEIK